MRNKFLMSILMAGTVVGCASNPPPPPPMAAAPAPMPAPAPMMMGPVDGVYRGMAELAADAPRSCRKMTKMQTVRVRNNAFVMGKTKVTINPDGSLTAAGRNASMINGTGNNGLDFTSMQGKCSYHYTLNKA